MKDSPLHPSHLHLPMARQHLHLRHRRCKCPSDFILYGSRLNQKSDNTPPINNKSIAAAVKNTVLSSF